MSAGSALCGGQRPGKEKTKQFSDVSATERFTVRGFSVTWGWVFFLCVFACLYIYLFCGVSTVRENRRELASGTFHKIKYRFKKRGGGRGGGRRNVSVGRSS